MKLFTIGHSNHSLQTFINLLYLHQVDAIADVRSHPYSRYLPHFNQSSLKTALPPSGIQYVFLGQQLGARASDPNCYTAGKAVYEKIAATTEFSQGIQRVVQGSHRYTIALMCAEKDPLTCHRAILVCQHLRQFDLDIAHIHKDGELETHTQLEERLLARHGFATSPSQQLSLFADASLTSSVSREESLIEAYRRQGDEIAYVEKFQENHEQVS
ncbi:DUF488 domain-containing protein [Leptolyngbya sp. GGD]|uniref:DUF488 domain-containing protein n=1 Tax=Leptolyngbya sp. GGD TaxID=2997907 RepID=UPI00227D3CD8|nr:DUF488 domain-containing protein [Leptolyngbya sp. GGD]MCY6494188.1 DUF488 domain-containing protein [Leptolyngbya sp. GGD]